MKLPDLKIVVSGAASGLGRHFAIRLAEAGASVALADVNVDGLEETRRLAGPHQSRMFAHRLDVSDEPDVARYVRWAHDQMGGLNALVNAAGIIRDALLVKKDKTKGAVSRLAKEHWDAVIGVNLTGAMLLARDCVEKMVSTATRPDLWLAVKFVLECDYVNARTFDVDGGMLI